MGASTRENTQDIPVVFTNRSGQHKTYVQCPYCGKGHSHSGTGLRASHCEDRSKIGPYEIRRA